MFAPRPPLEWLCHCRCGLSPAVRSASATSPPPLHRETRPADGPTLQASIATQARAVVSNEPRPFSSRLPEDATNRWIAVATQSDDGQCESLSCLNRYAGLDIYGMIRFTIQWMCNTIITERACTTLLLFFWKSLLFTLQLFEKSGFQPPTSKPDILHLQLLNPFKKQP